MKKKLKYILLLLLLFCVRLNAQTETTIDTATIEEQLPDIETIADSTVPEALIRERLAKLQNIFPMGYNKVTHQFIDFFTYRKPSFTKMMLERAQLYFPIYEQLLAKYGLPPELKYLSLIESGLNPRVLSYAGAGGLWQFMPRTGAEFGLKQDAYFDERFDPVKSTEASCRYMKQLYRIFGDWEMVLASYNTGPGNVKRAMRRSGGYNFWSIYDALPKQTRHYVPQYVAMIYMMHYANDHGIFAEKPTYPALLDTVQVSGYFNLFTFASMSGVSLGEIYEHNPQIISTSLPSYVQNYVLKIPSHYSQHIHDNHVAIWDSCSKLPFNPAILLANADSADSTGIATKITKIGGIVAASDETDDPETIIARRPKKLFHVVRRNETLTAIANRYGVNQYDLKKWNKLRTTKLLRGARLIVIKEVGKKVIGKHVLIAKNNKLKVKIKYHKVQSGDTLFEISQRYGLDVSRIKKLNRIRGNTVKKGQRLIVG
jgi:membrane-bound lytic murein transglycosylase D